MIKFDGRLQWKQYMPKKPVKWGIKIWCLCDSLTGYCLAFNVYTGKDDVEGKGLAHRIVMHLLRGYLGQHYHVYADNFFSSIPLVRDLLDNNTYYCGTIRKNSKGFPKQILEPKLTMGESRKVGRDGMMVCRWMDKRDVFFISSSHAGRDQVKQRSKFNSQRISVPDVVIDYNKKMGGVDHLDQFRSYYNVGRTGKKWWKYLFWGLFNIGIINAYIVWQLQLRPLPKCRKTWGLKAFKLSIVHALCDNFCGRQRGVQGINTQGIDFVVIKNLKEGHSLVRFQGRKKGCVSCIRAGRRTNSGRCIETSFGCSTCSAPLCKMPPCFQEFHSML
ncbi:hypothetical protein ACEWY4_013933 [Coilia grayii]|uniref:PiggyBac transposable element-derived protein domain-containing protein n=1 Tax=Coilia grayii TaxID=363190 RepID=A0ABD1JXT5_9TELE